MSELDDVYSNLIRVLAQRKNDEIFEIEILPSGFSALLRDGTSVGLNKKALVQAFIKARTLFFRSLCTMSEKELIESFFLEKEAAGYNDYSLNSSIATEVILLFDSEHLTACNWRRKRLSFLAQAINSPNDFLTTSPVSVSFVREMLERERSLLSTFLCSPLHRHTKSPTLWYHRLWVMTQLTTLCLRPHGCGHTESHVSQNGRVLLSKYIQATMLEEVTVALQAGERHLCNYYAFAYLRQFQRLMTSLPVQAEGSDKEETFAFMSEQLVDITLAWCLSHLRDISGWMFLLHVLDGSSQTERQKAVLGKVVNFALQIHWQGQALWTFVSLSVDKFGTNLLHTPLLELVNDMIRKLRGMSQRRIDL